MIAALKLLNEAAAKGWTFKVDQGDEAPIATKSGPKAWALVKEVDEASVGFFDAAGKRVGAAHLMAPGPNTCDPEETLVDHTCPGNEFEALCNKITEEAI
jgi:hypothetical protein